MTITNPFRQQLIEHLNKTPDPDLLHSLLLIGAEHSGAVDIEKFYTDFNALVARVSSNLDSNRPLADLALQLCHQLYEREGYRGNHIHYYDPKNSYIHEVLARKTGIPISLSVLYMAVAKQLGLLLQGVSFPGHFLTKLVDSGNTVQKVAADYLIIDPFSGTVLTDEDCRERLKAHGISVSGSLSKHLRPASHNEILVRVLNNLKVNFLEQDDLNACLSCCEKILLLLPDDPQAYLDRGLLYEQLECYSSAVEDYRTFLNLAPNSHINATIRGKISSLLPTRTIH